MNNEKAIKIFEEEINHTEQHLRCKDKSPEFYQEMKDWCEALKLGKKALEERPQGEWEDHSEEGYVECPICNHLTTCEDNIDELHYCWNCGAKMGKGGAE